MRRAYYPAAHNSGTRSLDSIRFLVIHDGEISTDEGIGSWLDNAAALGSAHRAVDDDSTQLLLDDSFIAWGAPPLNDTGLHLEQGGFASWTRDEWMAHEATVERAGYELAQWMQAHGIPNKFLSVADLLACGSNPAKPQGYTTHANISDAFHESTHTDPGSGYPLDVLATYIAKHLGGEEDDMGTANDYFDGLAGSGITTDDFQGAIQWSAGYQRGYRGKDNKYPTLGPYNAGYLAGQAQAARDAAA